MLVLSRRTGEQIIIDGDIIISILEICHGRVKVGVHAPSNTSIVREELLPNAAVPKTYSAGTRAGKKQP